MSNPFIAEVRIFSFGFAPRNWALCNGQTLLISQNQALFSLLGTTYGGNGQTTFALPNLQGRVPVYVGGAAGILEGQSGGEYSHTLSQSEIPPHQHTLTASTAGGTATPANTTLPGVNESALYTAFPATGGITNPVAMDSTFLANTGGQPHENTQPYLGLNFCMALFGIFPSRT